MPMKPTDVPHIRKLKGMMSAVAVSAMYHCNPETIRKIWRGETYKQDAPLATTFTRPVDDMPLPDGAEEFLAELMSKQKPEGEGEKSDS